MDRVAELYGASEIIRNSTQLVEAAFDGDIDEAMTINKLLRHFHRIIYFIKIFCCQVQNWLNKGFHIESKDGRNHTGLSEAACQGKLVVLFYSLAIQHFYFYF